MKPGKRTPGPVRAHVAAAGESSSVESAATVEASTASVKSPATESPAVEPAAPMASAALPKNRPFKQSDGCHRSNGK